MNEQSTLRNSACGGSERAFVTSSAHFAATNRPTYHRQSTHSPSSVAAGSATEDSGGCEVTAAMQDMAPDDASISSSLPIPDTTGFGQTQNPPALPPFDYASHGHPTMTDQQRIPRNAPFAIPRRTEFLNTETASTYEPYSPSHSHKKRKATNSSFIPIAPSPQSADVFATPGQSPHNPGLFGSQARGIRDGRPASKISMGSKQPPTPAPNVIAQLQQIPDMLSGGMSDLMQIMGQLAQNVNALEKRVTELERGNLAFKQQSMTSSEMPMGGPIALPQSVVGVPKQPQQSQSFGDSSAAFSPVEARRRNKDSAPLPGQAYGGPLYTVNPRGSGMFGATRQAQYPPPQFDGTESTNSGGRFRKVYDYKTGRPRDE
ncbi:hypothetical protein CERZMDRAFT_97961 [Cercospora zeae-maydis SCOH1-5]|uniref:Uncharacterized protein n=1 Tax=Cercospora zeae-maydis SCOH1-5 TaxID=717836 RepID=A0A6A6FF59_9PEZI|nr:hypothetical protein CERZMDRAFT_97961 [Cercospora zeae-maydis SCOH1-5]